MSINRNNFEAYMLDYLEGNLNPLMTAELMAFVAENPEYETLVPDFEMQSLLADKSTFSDKKILRKEFSDVPVISNSNFEEFCIAACEGLLNQPDLNRLEIFIAGNPEKQKILDTYKLLKLSPDKTILYPDKGELKKNTGVVFKRRFLYYGLSIAASVAVIMLLFFDRNLRINNTNQVNIPQVTAQISKPEIPPVPDKKTPIASQLAVSKHVTTVKVAPQTISEPLPGRESFVLSSLIPLKPELMAVVSKESDLLIEKVKYQPEPAVESKGLLTDLFTADSFIGSLVSHIDFWKTAEKAISGLNYLTETQLSLDRTVDENGNLTSLVVNTESYTIEGSSR
jgi:hypothetical protein